MSTPPFTGVGVALVTLFDDDGAVDADATADLAAKLVGSGVRAVLVAGTTGEAAALAGDERVALLDAVGAAVKSLGAAVLAGTGAATATAAAAFTADAAAHGADAILALSPPFARDVRPYYEAVAGAAAGVPVLAYHYPAVSAPGIPVATLPELPVVGCKDSTGDADRLLETLATWDGHLYPGSSAIVSYAGQLGLPGAILAAANAEPERCVRAFAGDGAAQRELAATNAAMRNEGFPHGIKRLTAERWGTSVRARLG